MLLSFLTSLFLFCLFTLALTLVAAVLELVQVANGYRPEGGNSVVALAAFVTTVLCLGAICVNAYLALRYVVGEIRR